MAQSISNETKNEAMKIAKATQKPGQQKEQTKLIALGIEKGISEYKKQQKIKARERDKHRKQEAKAKQRANNPQDELSTETDLTVNSQSSSAKLAWGLLILSWLGFAGYLFLQSH